MEKCAGYAKLCKFFWNPVWYGHNKGRKIKDNSFFGNTKPSVKKNCKKITKKKERKKKEISSYLYVNLRVTYLSLSFLPPFHLNNSTSSRFRKKKRKKKFWIHQLEKPNRKRRWTSAMNECSKSISIDFIASDNRCRLHRLYRQYVIADSMTQ